MVLRHLDLFSGIGGFSLGLEATGGFETVAFCDIEEFPRKVLQKHWPHVKQYEDIKELTYEKLKADGLISDNEKIDIITGGYPCQPFSVAGRKKVRKIRDTSGQSILGLSKSSGRLGSLERMLVDTLNSVLTPYLRTWRVKVTPLGRLVFQLLPSVPTTKERESGLWLTPSATTISERSKESMEKRKKYRESIGRTTVPPGNLAEQIQYGNPTTQMWRTPDAHCDRGPSSEERMKKKLDKGMPISLNDQVKHPNLMWPTPSAGMHKQDVKDDGRYARDIKEKGYQIMLPAAVKIWPTPRAALGMSMRLTENMAKLRHKKYLETEVAYHEHKSKAPGRGGGTLNPTWVEWLMGYPPGHTDLKD